MRDHRSIIAWQLGRAVAAGVYRMSLAHWSPPAGAAFAQLQRAALSVPLNIAEGYAWHPGKRWRNHIRIAYGSAIETGEVLDFMREVQAVPEVVLTPIILNSQRSQRMLLGLLKQSP